MDFYARKKETTAYLIERFKSGMELSRDVIYFDVLQRFGMNKKFCDYIINYLIEKDFLEELSGIIKWKKAKPIEHKDLDDNKED